MSRIALRQVGPVSVYCDGEGCHVLCLWHGIPVWQHIGQNTTDTSRHRRDIDLRCLSNVKPQQTKLFILHGKLNYFVLLFICKSSYALGNQNAIIPLNNVICTINM